MSAAQGTTANDGLLRLRHCASAAFAASCSYRDTGVRCSVVGSSLWPARRPGTRYQTTCEIRRVLLTAFAGTRTGTASSELSNYVLLAASLELFCFRFTGVAYTAQYVLHISVNVDIDACTVRLTTDKCLHICSLTITFLFFCATRIRTFCKAVQRIKPAEHMSARHVGPCVAALTLLA